MPEIIPAPISTKQQLRHKFEGSFFVPGLTKSVNREMKDADFLFRSRKAKILTAGIH